MTAQEIISQNEKTKTQRMKELAELGLSIKEIANLMGTNYGFAYNAVKGIRGEARRATTPTAFEFSFSYKYGIEIEVANLRDREAFMNKVREAGVRITEAYRSTQASSWKVTNDGSISGGHGAEIVSPPLRGQEGLEELKKICEALKDCGAKVNRSTGIHVHIEAPSRSLSFFKKLYTNYILSEREIDKAMPESRRANNNLYCKSMKVSGWKNRIKRATTVQSLEREITGRNRYYKLNLQSFWRQGTVEYRQHSGSINATKISNWVLFVMRMTEYSLNHTMRENQTPWGAFAGQELKEYYEGRIEDLEA